MEVLSVILIFAFLFYLKRRIDSNFDRLQDNIDEKIDQKFKDLYKKLDDCAVSPKNQSKENIVDATDNPKIEQTVLNRTLTIEKEDSWNDVASKKEFPKENTQKIVYSGNISSEQKSVQHQQQIYNREPSTKKSFWETFRENNPDLEKFIGENLINKVGILILVLGISYFVKYAIDKDWINEPARVGIGMLSGGLIMTVAHKLRKNYAAFSSVFVAGAITVFYFTIGIAFHSYHLFGQTVAFTIMVLITVFSSLISLSYNRKELAVLSLIGGFAVPFMVSTDQGNYVVLFTYIIILNIGILSLAYYKKWTIINILSYVFTVILFGTWLVKDLEEKTPHYLGALMFSFVFYLIFIGINIINNVRTKGVFVPIELGILASNTFLFYAAQMIILDQYHPELKGLFTASLGLLNLIYAWFLYKKFGVDKTAIYLLIGLTLTFVTLAVPIQFNGNFITLFWAAESITLMWLAQKSKITYYRFASIIVNYMMIISLIIDWKNIYSSTVDLNIVFNKICMTGLFAIFSIFSVYYLIKNETENQTQFKIVFNPKKYGSQIVFIGIIISYFTGVLEVSFQSDHRIIGANSAMTVPILFHLIFSTLLCYWLYSNKKSYQIASIIAATNIVMYSFWFSNYPFYEHTEYISTGIYQRTGFYLHYFSLLTISYFGYILYQINQENKGFDLFNKKIVIWIAVFLITYISSTELMLHGLVISNSPTLEKDLLFNDVIQETSDKIIKTGYPILWGILAFIFLIIGIRKRIKNLRIIALSLLGITIVKLFLFDISNASETGKIIAFILLGVLILIISFVYQKLKVLIKDDQDTKDNNETE